MTLINARWPRTLCPETCKFARVRNDVLQTAPASLQTTVIRRGRPLWGAELSWSLANTERLAQLRYWLESLDGYSGSVQIWDFTSPWPYGLTLATTADIEYKRLLWVNGAVRPPWTWAGLPYQWTLDSTITVSANVAAGATSVSFSGLTPSTIAAVQGQYIQIGRRLYIVAQGATSDGSGNVTITLTSPLLAAATAGDTARLVEAACEMRLANQNFDAQSRAGDGLVIVTASFLETVTDFS